MTITNHAATGALVALAIGNPWVGIPAAFASHFVVDVIPHWDYKFDRPIYKQAAILLDLTLCLYLVLVLALTVDASRRLIIVGAFLGVLPDAMWLPEAVKGEAVSLKGRGLLIKARRFHSRIQWCEKSWGIVVEAAWLAITLAAIYHIHN